MGSVALFRAPPASTSLASWASTMTSSAPQPVELLDEHDLELAFFGILEEPPTFGPLVKGDSA